MTSSVPPFAIRGGDGFTGTAPNPFSVSTALWYQLPVAESVRLEVYEVGGRRVWSVAPGVIAAGVHSVIWDGRDSQDKEVDPGVYFARLSAKGRSWTRTIIHVK